MAISSAVWPSRLTRVGFAPFCGEGEENNTGALTDEMTFVITA
jgi:hypothetical protein